VIFIIATVLFVVCTISTLTSVREEPLVVAIRTEQFSKRNNRDETDNDSFSTEDDEKQPLLGSRRYPSRRHGTLRSERLQSNPYLTALTYQEGFVELDPATGSRIPHDHVEQSNDNIVLRTLERSHQVISAAMATTDPSNPVLVSTQAFDTELRQKAKLVKLGRSALNWWI
jgi:hypothetical protein